MSSHEAVNRMAEKSQKRKTLSTTEPAREPNGEPASKAMRADVISALSPLSRAVMAYIQQLRHEEAEAGITTTAREHPTSKVAQAASAESAHSVPVIWEQIEAYPSTLATTAVRRQPTSNIVMNGASVQDSHPITVKQEQVEPGPSTSENAAVLHDGGEHIGDVKLKKITKVELQRGHRSWYTGTIPAFLKVTEESGETREIFHFAQLDGCLVDEMVFECRDKTTDKLVRQLYKDKSIAVHVKRLVVRKLGGGQSWDHFESGIKRLQELSEALRSLQLIVWEGMTDNHLSKLYSFASRKLVFEYPDDVDDLERTRENFAEIFRRLREPPVKVEKYFTLPAPLHINTNSFGGHLYEITLISLIKSLHKVHKNDGHIVTRTRPVPPTHSIRGFWMLFATSLFEFVNWTANPASRLPEHAAHCAWASDAMRDVKDIIFRIELDYRDGAREEFEKFAKSQAVDVKSMTADSLAFVAKYGSYKIRCAYTLEPSVTVKVHGREEVPENSLVSIRIVKRE